MNSFFFRNDMDFFNFLRFWKKKLKNKENVKNFLYFSVIKFSMTIQKFPGNGTNNFMVTALNFFLKRIQKS